MTQECRVLVCNRRGVGLKVELGICRPRKNLRVCFGRPLRPAVAQDKVPSPQHGHESNQLARHLHAAGNSIALGLNLQTNGTVTLGAFAPAGGLDITLTSNSPSLLLSNTGTAAGSSTRPAGHPEIRQHRPALPHHLDPGRPAHHHRRRPPHRRLAPGHRSDHHASRLAH